MVCIAGTRWRTLSCLFAESSKSPIISEGRGMGPGVYGDDDACDASPRSADFVLASNI
jgi:hypothetical protein